MMDLSVAIRELSRVQLRLLIWSIGLLCDLPLMYTISAKPESSEFLLGLPELHGKEPAAGRGGKEASTIVITRLVFWQDGDCQRASSRQLGNDSTRVVIDAGILSR